MHGYGGGRRSKPLTQSNASNLAVASWPVDPVTSATHPSGARLNGGRRPISVPFAVHPCLRVARALDRLSRDQEDVAGLYKQLSFCGAKLLTLSNDLGEP